ncbi:hypothetical protein DQ354_17615 [Arthrobacter sp. AQ5-06]|nr:hypothetical protein DQ354_17615 [Arthrobacter sp. AQ5-06]
MDSPGLSDAADALFHLSKTLGLADARETLLAAAAYLLTQISDENDGAVYKSAQARHVDILNGDVYAAAALSHAYEVSGTDRFLKSAIDIVDHVESRFGAVRPGWWLYSVSWEGEPVTGASVAYQATIVGSGIPICGVLEPQRALAWKAVPASALDTVRDHLPPGPLEESEAPT